MPIRPAAATDVIALATLEKISYPKAEGASADSIKRRIAVFPNHFWLLEEEGEILSFINGMVTDIPNLTDEMYEHAELHNEKGAWQMLFSVVTAPKQRGKGCAATVMGQALADAKKAGRRGVVLTCKKQLLTFYQAFGFVNEGISASAHGGITWYQMRLIF